jgi:hypothetical protein
MIGEDMMFEKTKTCSSNKSDPGIAAAASPFRGILHALTT